MRLKMPNLNDQKNQRLAVIGLAAVVAVGLIVYATTSGPGPSFQDSSGSQSQSDRAVVVQITSEGFMPATIKVLQGSQVTWVNTDNKTHKIASNPHPTHSDVKGLESPDLGTGASYTHTFDQKGSFGYHNHLNVTRLGTVIVE